MESYKNASKHVAVLAFPFGTHAAPLLSIVRRLSAAVPGSMFSFLSTEQSNAKMFPKDKKLYRIKPFNVEDGLPEGYIFRGNPHEPVEYFLKAMPGNFTKVIDELVAETERPIDFLIADAFYWFGGDIGDELNVPWVAVWTAGPRPLFVHVEAEVIRQHVGVDGPPEKPLDFLEGFSAIRAADLPDGITSTNFHGPIPALLDKMGQALSRTTAIVANSYEDLDNTVVNQLKSKFKNYLNVGPFNLISVPPTEDTHGCLVWLNNQEPASVAYISFGSVITPPPHELEALSKALEEGNLPFLWSLRGNPEQLLPKGFLEKTSSKGKIVPWAPQQEVLKNPAVGVFVTHGGWNSVLESISGGVPMILRPFFGDQGLNTRTVEAVWGFGLGLEGGTFTKEGTIKALKIILASEEGNRMRERIGVQKELALKAVEPNGSSIENFQKLVKIVGT